MSSPPLQWMDALSSEDYFENKKICNLKVRLQISWVCFLLFEIPMQNRIGIAGKSLKTSGIAEHNF